MNMRPENRCVGSERPSGASPLHHARTTCHHCWRPGIQIRTDGSFFIHSKVSRASDGR